MIEVITNVSDTVQSHLPVESSKQSYQVHTIKIPPFFSDEETEIQRR